MSSAGGVEGAGGKGGEHGSAGGKVRAPKLTHAAKKWAREKWGPNWAMANLSGVSSDEIKRRKMEAATHNLSPGGPADSAGLTEIAPLGLLPSTVESSSVFGALPDVPVLAIVNFVDFVELLRLRATNKATKLWVDEHIPDIYANTKRRDPALPDIRFLPFGAPERDPRNLELFQDAFDPNRDKYEVFITMSNEGFRGWMVEAEQSYDGMDYYSFYGNMKDAVVQYLREKYPESFFEKDGQNYAPIVNVVINTGLSDIKRADPCNFPDWIRNIKFLVGYWERSIDISAKEEDEIRELNSKADELEAAVRRLLAGQNRRGHQFEIEVAIASYSTILRMNGWDAIVDDQLTVNEYRKRIEGLMETSEQWRNFLPDFNEAFNTILETHPDRGITENTKIAKIKAIADHYYNGGSPRYWRGTKVMRKVRI